MRRIVLQPLNWIPSETSLPEHYVCLKLYIQTSLRLKTWTSPSIKVHLDVFRVKALNSYTSKGVLSQEVDMERSLYLDVDRLPMDHKSHMSP